MRLRMWRFVALALSLGVICGGAEKAIVLVESGVQVADYNDKIASITEGSTLVFARPDGTRTEFVVREVLSRGRLTNTSGNTTFVASIGDGSQVIRLPLHSGRFSPKMSYADFMRAFMDGYRNLSKMGVEVVSVDERGSWVPHYILCENLNAPFNLEELVARYRDTPLGSEFEVRGAKMTHREADVYLSQLGRFAASTYRIAASGDLKTSDVVYSQARGRWVLADLFDKCTLAEHLDDSNVFSRQELPGKVREAVNQAVAEKRKGWPVRENDCRFDDLLF